MTVCVSEAAGQTAYCLLSRMAVGEVFGAGACVNLRLVDTPKQASVLEGVKMELEDCAAPCVGQVTCVQPTSSAIASTLRIAECWQCPFPAYILCRRFPAQAALHPR